ncbi:non-ribosomal peptide synthetase, partial [Aldersonia kunmingensis]|uniref:non-ribosomal peptide synthetase n=1 Tax=Aldersonia kunmingensis TaxID=408066 RepID=UPI000A7697C3
MTREVAGEAVEPGSQRRRRSERPSRRPRSARTPLLPQLLAAAVEANPDGVALVGDRALTYGELDAMSSRIARLLIGRGYGPESFVAIGMRRSIEYVVSLWAVAKTGAAFLPIDPAYPRDRIEYLLSDSGAKLGLTTVEHAATLGDVLDWIVLDDPATVAAYEAESGDPVSYAERVSVLRAENPAYVIYTSGSTGRPKGVLVPHGGLASLCAEQRERYGVTPQSRVLQFGSPSFDISVGELLTMVGAGATMVITPPDLYGGPDFADFLRRERVTHTLITPSALATLDPTDLDDLSVVVVGGEVCPPELADRWGSRVRFHNGYGPTETTILTHISDPLVPGERVTIGAPLPNTASWVLDAGLRRVPVDVVGELYLSGPELARGYHERRSLTADRFVANPYAAGERMYRTGDLVRWTESGEIDYVGRSDFQVKIRGFRIELGEIDSVLNAFETVDFAVTIGHTSDAGSASLVAYVLPVDGAELDTDALAEHAAEHLPAHMLPALYMVLDEIPLTVNGKLDRRALPTPVFEAAEYRAPNTPIEQAVAEVFAEVLGIERIGLDDHFFALGGNSILATRVAARLGAVLDRSVPVRLLFEAPSVERFAVAVESDAGAGRVALVAGPRPELVPLSFAQQRMWFLNQLDPDSAAYNVRLAIRLTGDLDIPALEMAVRDLVARHESLRTIYPEVEGFGPVQKVLPVAEAGVELVVESVTTERTFERVHAVLMGGFDAQTRVPVRAHLLDVSDAPGEHVLVVAVHHVSADGASVAPLARDVMVAYESRTRGEAPGWAPMPVQYADFALWQREVLGSEEDPESLISRQIAYWAQQLAGAPDQLDVPSDRPRPAVASGRGGVVPIEVSANVHAALVDLGRAYDTTLFIVVHAALAVLLARLSGTDDISVGTPIAGRGERELDDLIGMFVNTLVLRTVVDSSESFVDLLARTRETDLGAFGNADLPFERLVEVLDPARSQARNPLFQVGLSFQNLAESRFELPGLTVEPAGTDAGLSQFDLNFIIGDSYDEHGTPMGLGGEVTFATDLFDEATVAVFAQRFGRLLESVVTDASMAIGDIELLDPAERTAVLTERNATDTGAFDGLLLDRFERAAATSPDAVAVVYEGAQLTYGEFADRVNQLARHLISMGVGPESRVVLAMRRSLDLVVGMYAVVTAGGAYVPVDPDHPAERIGWVLESSDPVAVLSTTRDGFDAGDKSVVLLDTLDLSQHLAAPLTDADRVAPVRRDNSAYVIYTSGSTGRPKGVAVPHAAIVNQVGWMIGEYDITAGDIYLQKTATTFDVSLWGYFLPLAVGARLIVATPDGHRDPAYQCRVIAEHGVTLTDTVPSMLSVFAREARAEQLVTLRDIFLIGEALPIETVRAFAKVSSARVQNLYGPTEAAVSITAVEVPADATSVTIGVLEANSRAYVLDSRLRLVPDGVSGELYLAGVQLARGYHGRPDLSSDRFVADPFDPAGGRMYRTGDLVRWTLNSELDYLGRTDFQVKFRGQRIELGEIETALLAQEQIGQAVAIVRADDLGDRLVAYVVPRVAGTEIVVDELRAAVKSLLPSYMVPESVIVLDAFPLNVSGKLDRKALPEPVFAVAVFRAPTTPVEQAVAGVFAEVLGIGATGDGSQQVGLDDDFFALGGNSLLATRVTSRLGAVLDATVPVRMLFEAPTVERLAVAVESHTGTGRVALVAGPRPERVPLSLAQQRMWFLNRFDPDSVVNNLPMAIRLSGALNVDALQAAIGDLLVRHESLRTIYPEIDGVGFQQVLPAAEVALDLAPVSVDHAEVYGEVAGFVGRGFDVTVEVPVRARLLRVADVDDITDGTAAPDEFVLIVVVHHIAGDGFSMGPLARDVMVAYESRTRGEAPGWAPLPVQFADFALWQREVLGSDDDPESLLSRQIAYWSDQLAGVPDQLDLPADRPRPAVASGRGAAVAFDIPADLHTALVGVARAHDSTLFMVVHAALAVLLARLSGTGDIAVGTPIAGRGERELDDLIGMFVNTLVLRTGVDGGESFTDLLAQTRETDLAAFGHADVPFERLVEILDPVRSQARNPLFQVLLSFENFGQAEFELPGLSVSGLDAGDVVAKFDLSVTMGENPATGGLFGSLAYATDLFDESTMQVFGQRLVRVLEAVAADPAVSVGDVEIFETGELAALLAGSAGTGHDVAEALLLDGFERAAVATPDATAVVFEGESLTYAEFSARVNRLARHLVSLGVGPESRVAVAMRRGTDLLTGIYAVLAAGGAYVPVDPDHPADRTAYVLESADPVVVLTTTDAGVDVGDRSVLLLDTLDVSGYSADLVTDADRVAPLRTANTAYVIYTSGSTGRPKGVAVSHSAIVNQLAWFPEQFDLSAADVVLWKTPTTFDASVWELFAALRIGAGLVVAAADGHRDPAYLAALIEEQSVTTVQFVPSMLSVFVTEVSAGRCASLRRVFTGGEALSGEVAQRMRAAVPGVVVHNLYGPTEATVQVTARTASETDVSEVPIGSPAWNTQVYVLDARLRPVPSGVMGELYLAGAQLARGYVSAAGLSAERFVSNPFGAGDRLYRTGDLVRWGKSGELEYVGRTDFQVKLRGQRIELGEIEAALLAVEGVRQSVVMVHDDGITDRLVGYVIGDAALDADAVRGAVAERVPSYMVPERVMVLEAFPLNSSGKLDRRALPAPVFEAAVFRAPTTPVEQAVAAVFAEVLRVERVGLDDDFFALGGNSLLAMQVASRLGAALDATIPVRVLFEAPVVERLAVAVESQAGTGRVALEARPRPEQIPLSFAQSRMWFLNQLDPESSVNNIPMAIRLSGELDTAALQLAVADVVARHESLRTIYPEIDGFGFQQVVSAADAVLDLSPVPVVQAGVFAEVAGFVGRGFDVTERVPVRARLLRITDVEDVADGTAAPDEFVLVVVVHHIAGDGFSMGPLARDVMVAYESRTRGEVPGWAPLPVQYADYTLWQREVLGSEDDPESLIAGQVDYWTKQLAGVPEELGLPFDRPRPAVASFAGAAVGFEIDADLHAGLIALARAHDATPFMVVHAALAVLLARLSGGEDVAIGTPITGRGERELDDLIGMFVNTLVLRTGIEGGASVADLLGRVRETDLAAFGHADVPFERLVEVLDPVRSQARNPLFQVMLAFQNFAQTEFALPGLTVAGLDAGEASLAKFDLSVTVAERDAASAAPGGLVGSVVYAVDLFDEATVTGFTRRLVRMLEAMVADAAVPVGDISILEAGEQAALLAGSAGTARVVDEVLLLDGFERAVAATPDATAVVFEGESFTYAEFSARVNRLARHLVSLGVGPESRVAVAMRRGTDLLTAIYAVVTAGGAYVPVDPDHPAERIGYVLDS